MPAEVLAQFEALVPKELYIEEDHQDHIPTLTRRDHSLDFLQTRVYAMLPAMIAKVDPRWSS